MTTFTTDCTLPDGLVNYVTSPNTRGTLQILWSSLTAIFLCTWTTQHLNVPQQSSPKTHLQIWTRRIHRFVDRLKWLFINLLTPEFLIGKAFCDRVSAEQHSRVYKATAEEDGVLWGRSHCFFANMGGFVLDFDTRSESSSRLTHPDGSDHHRDTRTNASSEDDRVAENERLNISRAFTTPLPSKRSPRDLESWISTELASGKEKYYCPVRSPKLQQPLLEDSLTLQQKESESFERIRRWEDDPSHCSSAHIQKELASSHAVGELRWTADAVNTALVKAALEQTQIQDFPTIWEREAYLLFPDLWYLNLLVLQGNVWSLDACQLLLARKMGIIKKLPQISQDELDDRSKGDVFVKGLALVQVIGLFMQIVARGAAGFPPAQLEIAVIAFALCGFIIYILLLDKPQNVGTPVYISASRRPSRQELSRLAITGPDPYPPVRWNHLVPNHATHCVEDNTYIDHLTLGFVVGAVSFGALHCAAWNLRFPTSIEHLLWKIASVLTTAVPLVWIAPGKIVRELRRNTVKQKSQSSRTYTKIFDRLLVVLVVLYIVARLYIMVELFRSLLFLDPKAFASTWSSNIPHIM